jgi:hypothetical protein
VELKRHYQVYCKILANVIDEAKRTHYDKKIQNSSNKCKATWDVIKELTNNQHSHPDIQDLIIDNKHLKDQQDIIDACNNYFSSVIDKINIKNMTNTEKLPTFHYYLERNYDYLPHLWLLRPFQQQKLLL